MNEAPEYPSEVAELYRSRRDALCNGLRRIGWDVPPPRGTMFVWAGLPEPYRHLSSMEFALKLAREAKVAVSPGAGFGPGGDGHVRFALVENEQRILQAIRVDPARAAGARSRPLEVGARRFRSYRSGVGTTVLQPVRRRRRRVVWHRFAPVLLLGALALVLGVAAGSRHRGTAPQIAVAATPKRAPSRRAADRRPGRAAARAGEAARGRAGHRAGRDPRRCGQRPRALGEAGAPAAAGRVDDEDHDGATGAAAAAAARRRHRRPQRAAGAARARGPARGRARRGVEAPATACSSSRATTTRWRSRSPPPATARGSSMR